MPRELLIFSVSSAILAVTTHERRADAHAFYQRIGFEQTGRRFGKALVPHS